MTSRTRSPQGPSGGRRDTFDDVRAAEEAERLGWGDAPARLRAALGVAVLAAALLTAGALVGVVQDSPPAGYDATVLLVLLAFLVPVVAGGLVLAGRALAGAGVLVGAGLLAPGRAVADLVFVGDALRAARPEFFVPADLTELEYANGVWLLVAGHLAAALAGLLAAGRAGAAPDSAYGLEVDAGTGDVRARRRALGWAVAAGPLAVVGLALPPFHSTNAFLLDQGLIDASTFPSIGGLLVVAAVLGGSVYAATTVRRGVVIGLLAATAGITVPQIVAGLVVERVEPTAGPYLALAALALLAAGLRGRVSADQEPGGELAIEPGRVHLATGLLGVLTGIAALVGAVAPLLVVEGADDPAAYANRQLVPAGILVGVLGAALLHHRWAATVRPAFVVSLASVVVVAAAALDAAFTGSGSLAAYPGIDQIDTIRTGAGAWFAGASVVLAAAAAITATIAGSAERDDVDLTERSTHLPVVAPVAAAILFSVGAFGFPMITAPNFVAPGIWTDFRFASWGLVLGVVVVVVAGVVAALARPARAAALLLGAAAVVGVHALELPLTSGRVADATAGSGTWLSLACCLALLVGAAIAAAGPAPDQDRAR
ncbi:hypothetical protein [Actinophytocola gossypii]|uniref:Uncharacterized protein n=1 Tax=Actinophytocola gossypii TaxID=2812003 RepID=A0ABT2JJR0_9PSEU|nr:hypothetical protein [Actinophytocola gossypii]MCT2588127.1 hypothetical protein [Actinophytocola gossypii]